MSFGVNPLVSVRLMVYNNEPFIREAVESILIQKTEFKVEIVVGDDFSSDNTLNIIKEYADTPNIYFKILKRKVGGQYWEDRKRLGRLHNFKNIIENCSGKYIALLDGDDFWKDPLKLQKQVDLLESKSNINVCFTQAEVLTDLGLMPHQTSPEFIENEFGYSKLLKYNNFITTASVVFRKPNNFHIPEWFLKIPYGDMGLYKLLSDENSFYGLNDITSVYRVHDKGIYSGMNLMNSRKIYYSFYKRIYPYLSEEEQGISKSKMRLLKKEIATLRFPKRVIFQKLYFIYLKVKGLDLE